MISVLLCIGKGSNEVSAWATLPAIPNKGDTLITGQFIGGIKTYHVSEVEWLVHPDGKLNRVIVDLVEVSQSIGGGDEQE